jgi:hypothetical protein
LVAELCDTRSAEFVALHVTHTRTRASLCEHASCPLTGDGTLEPASKAAPCTCTAAQIEHTSEHSHGKRTVGSALISVNVRDRLVEALSLTVIRERCVQGEDEPERLGSTFKLSCPKTYRTYRWISRFGVRMHDAIHTSTVRERSTQARLLTPPLGREGAGGEIVKLEPVGNM